VIIRHVCFAAGLAAALLTLAILTGCYCFEYDYVSFEGQADFVITKRTTRFMGGSARTFPPVPIEYQVTRAAYVLKISTGEVPYPVLNIEALDMEGNPLRISGPDMKSRYGPEIPEGIERGSWTFDVLRDDERIGSESFGYEIKSRKYACDLKK
jgi:hypothetical protein